MARQPFDDPYVYPGTRTLKNHFGLHDPSLLRLAEYAVTRQRGLDAPSFPVTADGFKATHRHLFQDVFPWAGQIRTVGLTHPQNATPFAFPNMIEDVLSKQFGTLQGARGLAGLGAAAFAAKVADHIGELNAIHAFREGNGRTMRLHLRQLAAQAGHELDDTRMPAKAWNDASNISFHKADSRPLAAVIAQALGPPARLAPTAAQVAAALSPDASLVYAAMAEKVDRQMAKLTPAGKAEMRRFVAEELVRREAAEGPILLTPEQRSLATGPGAGPDEIKRSDPAPPKAPRRRR